MSEFDERERAFERGFELEEELKFKTNAGTAYLFGLWVAEQLGLKGQQGEAYARQMVDMVIAKAAHDHIIAKAEKDLQAKDINLSRHRLEKEFNNCYRMARERVTAGG
jgi:hypothetical protein